MSDKLTNATPSEEVDLGQLFKLIGGLVKKIGAFIQKVFNTIFDFIIRFFLFVRRHFIKIVLATVVGAVLGFLLEKKSKDVYESKMLVEPNYGSTFQLFSNVGYYNQLVSEGDTVQLSKIFGLTNKEANSLVAFEIIPGPENENEKLMAFDKFIKTADSVTVSMVDYESFKEQMNVYNSSKYEIVASSREKDIFPKLESAIVLGVQGNDYLNTFKVQEQLRLNARKKDLIDQLGTIDSLKNVYNQVLISQSKLSSVQSTGVLATPNVVKTQELNLLDRENNINNELRDIDYQLSVKEQFLNVLSRFQTVGTINKEWYENKVLILAVLGFISMILFLLLTSFNKFLNRYEG